ncbi:urea carboxylase [Corynebacterium xerosis]|uniref:Urea carboxylase n=1 Tax=Corynebacterium xerosis TaxID=1725 RepID=A0A2N6SYV3_9CORY|nr:urea amidolyase associated protein UAAP1 [Corynebacterium xerosis]PMC62244.1 urea carboxylase [Corynebacterium xerosis]
MTARIAIATEPTDNATGSSGPDTAAGTGDTAGALADARSRGGQLVDPMRFIPPTTDPALPDDLDPETVTWAENVPAGSYTTAVVARGSRIRLTNRDGAGCAHLMIWRADAPHERLSVADTMKVPWQAYLGVGHPLLSDQGRLLASIVADGTEGAADALCGATTRRANRIRYGGTGNDENMGRSQSPAPAARELLILAAAKNGLAAVDVPPSISFFHGVRVAPDGDLVSTGDAAAGAEVEFIAHVPLIVAVANTAHPLDERVPMATTTVSLHGWEDCAQLDAIAASIEERDPEYVRAWQNTESDLRMRNGSVSSR